MRLSRKIGFAVLTGLIAFGGLEMGNWFSSSGVTGFVSSAHAVVGRPLTPLSVAGVARRTVRRCAVGIYHC